MDRTMEFFRAINEGDVPRIRSMIIDDPSLVHGSDQGGACPLHWAAWRGDREIVDLLHKNGAGINQRDQFHGSTPMGWAVEYLRKRGGCLVSEIEDLLFALREQNVTWVRRFLERQPSLRNAMDSEQIPLAQHARETQNEEIIRLFHLN